MERTDSKEEVTHNYSLKHQGGVPFWWHTPFVQQAALLSEPSPSAWLPWSWFCLLNWGVLQVWVLLRVPPSLSPVSFFRACALGRWLTERHLRKNKVIVTAYCVMWRLHKGWESRQLMNRTYVGVFESADIICSITAHQCYITQPLKTGDHKFL